MLRAIVFDFDGVIANSEPLHFRGYRDVLSGVGVQLAEGDYYARYLGYDDVEAFQAIAADHGLPWTSEQIAALVERKAERLETLERDVSILFPGAADAIRRAAAQVPLAIASGALGAEIRRVLDREDLSRYFAVIVAAEDASASKPAPDPYLRAVQLLGEAAGGTLHAGDCVAIEDSHWGLDSARAAGLRTVAVAHTYPATELTAANLVIADISALDLTDLHRLRADRRHTRPARPASVTSSTGLFLRYPEAVVIKPQFVRSFTHAALSPDPDLAIAALMIARVEYPKLDAGPYLDQLDALGREAARRVGAAVIVAGDAPPRVDPDRYARVMALNDYLFKDLCFVGNCVQYEGSAEQLPERGPRPPDRHSDHAGAALHRGRAAGGAPRRRASTFRATSCFAARRDRGGRTPKISSSTRFTAERCCPRTPAGSAPPPLGSRSR